MNAIPETMRAFVLTGHGGFDKLVFHDDWPVPTPGPGEALVKVAACGLNNTDINTRIGWYSKGVTGATGGEAEEDADSGDSSWGGAPLAFPRIQGGDVAGRVMAVGAGGDESLIGKRVLIDTVLRDWDDPLNIEKCGYFGSECDGGYAEYTKVDQRNICPIDSNLSDAELATFAISYSTAENMLSRAKVGEDDTVLIPGASGGVGSALIQLARRRGATTIALASESKHKTVAEVGADVILPRDPDDLPAALREAIGSPKVSVVADVVGGDAFPTVIEALKRGGRYTCSGAIAGPIVSLDLRTMYLNDLTFTGATILPPNIFPDLVGYIERGEVRPLLAATYPLEELHAAQEAFMAKKHVGNIVVTMD